MEPACHWHWQCYLVVAAEDDSQTKMTRTKMPSDSESKIVEMAPSREDASLIRVTCIDSDSAEEPSAILVNCQTRTRSQLQLKNQELEGRLGRPSDEDPGGRVAQETVTMTAAACVCCIPGP